jgi:myo-inositol-1(or 4)-monophosphatase
MLAQTLIDAAEAAADVAATVIRPFFRQNLAADSKDDESPVTIADRSAEQAMRAVLAQRFPEHGIMGEEFGLDRPGASYRWVLDPIDGTRAFITGRPTFGTLIALLEDGIPILGVIDQPISRERWVGIAGQTTTFNGASIRARRCPTLAQAELSCTAPEIFSQTEAAGFHRLQSATRRTSWGGDCYAYGLLALGHIDVIAEAGLKIWDWAALVPIIQGAGGSITDWSGKALTPDSDGTALALGNPALLAAAIESLKC